MSRQNKVQMSNPDPDHVLPEMPATLRELVEGAGRFYKERTAYTFRNDRGEIESVSFQMAALQAKALARSFSQHGLCGVRSILLGENAYEWILSYLAQSFIGTVVPLDHSLSFSELSALAVQCDSSCIICSEGELERARLLMKTVSSIRSLIVWLKPDSQCYLQNNESSFSELLQSGEDLLRSGNEEEAAIIDPESAAAILFTSGTTGPNKGVILSHKNICAVVEAVSRTVPYEDTSISLLPMNHALEFNCHILSGFFCGIGIFISSSLKRVGKDIAFAAPKMAVVVPMFLDMINDLIWRAARKKGCRGKIIFLLHISGFFQIFGIDLRQRFFHAILKELGVPFTMLVCGGAPISSWSAKGLHDLGIDIYNGYGLTECAPLVSVNLSRKRFRLPLVGKPVYGVSIRLHDPDRKGIGEIAVQGNNVSSGYFHDPESTARSFQDGWFFTGDLGAIDRTGSLRIVGRKKNLIILENGKNVVPEEIESFVVENTNYISEVLVYALRFRENGSGQSFIGATIRIWDGSPLYGQPLEKQIEKVSSDLHSINRELASYKRIGYFRISSSQLERNSTYKKMRQYGIVTADNIHDYTAL